MKVFSLATALSALLLAASSAFAQTPETTEAVTDPVVENPAVGDTTRDTNSGAAAASPDDPTSKDVENDKSLSALGVGEYGKHSENFVLWDNPKYGAYIKPIINVSTAVVAYFPDRPENSDNASVVNTQLIARFGFEGAVTDWASFKLEFQRDLGFNIGAGGPIGTGIWEGTASFQARENYINLHRWGFTLVGGIQIDPASVDFISSHVLDLFGMDPFVRDPLLYSGFNLGQGVLLRYEIPGLQAMHLGRLVAGFQYTSGNPLTTSTSYSFGGNVTATGTLYTVPFRALTNGLPGSNINLTVYSPSLTYEIDFAQGYGFDARLAAQFYRADIDTTVQDDKILHGANFRATGRLRLKEFAVMGGWSRRYNNQYLIPDLTAFRGDGYESTTWNVGGEWNHGRFGVGVHYSQVLLEYLEDSKDTLKYLSVGASYQLLPSYLAAGVRYSQLVNDYTNITVTPIDAKALIVSLRLTI